MDVQLYREVRVNKILYNMDSKERTIISVQAMIDAPVELVWKNFTTPDDITRWNYASDDWQTPHAENDLRAGGKFLSRMEAKDGSYAFDFEGIYDIVKTNEYIEYHIVDGRKVKIVFSPVGKETKIVQSFEAEAVNSVEQQRTGWQAILNNFKKYVEGK
jgi:uncharacterized protein YndB with AHSA1/START domain